MKKKIKTSDLNLSPKPVGSSGLTGESNAGKKPGADTKAITVRPTDQDKCLETFACPSTMDCPMTERGCETGKVCYETGNKCIDTEYCIPYTRNVVECVTRKECDTVACTETTPESPCVETQVKTVCVTPPLQTNACGLETASYFTCGCETNDASCEETSENCED
ncbi:hypothetical protein [uncultured Muribaculum sp.]|uniref:hypothetical protein n=1 Tax=uncultured Muribaculum sp. TaxID=1918613 RepID=UPI0025DEBF97|nr:hypothetical protein [uncultured Muribaculum sp.]